MVDLHPPRTLPGRKASGSALRLASCLVRLGVLELRRSPFGQRCRGPQQCPAGHTSSRSMAIDRTISAWLVEPRPWTPLSRGSTPRSARLLTHTGAELARLAALTDGFHAYMHWTDLPVYLRSHLRPYLAAIGVPSEAPVLTRRPRAHAPHLGNGGLLHVAAEHSGLLSASYTARKRLPRWRRHGAPEL
jgi:hypothetical protein